MALQKQLIPIPLGTGINTKVDKKQLSIGKLASLKNAVLREVGNLRKRYGLKKKGQTEVVSGDVITSNQVLGTFQSELFRISNNSFYSYAEGNDAWVNKGMVAGASVTSRSVIRNAYTQDNPVVAGTSGILVYAWEDSSGGIRASVFDKTSKQSLAANVLISATGTRPRVVANDSYIYIYYTVASNTSIRVTRLNPGSPTAFESEQTLSTDTHATDPYFDVAPFGNNFVFAYRVVAGYKVGYLAQTGLIGTPVEGFPTAITSATVPTRCLGISAYFAGDIINDAIYVLVGNGSGITAEIYQPILVLDSSVVVDASVTTALQVVGINESADSVRVIYDQDAASTYNKLTKHNTVSRSGVVGTAVTLFRSVSIWSKPWIEQGTTFVVLSYESTLQSAYYTVSVDGDILNRISYQLAGGGLGRQSVAGAVFSDDGSLYLVPLLIKTKLFTQSGTLYSITGVQESEIGFEANRFYATTQLGSNLHVAAGLLESYDGARVTEHGFNYFPENPSSTINAGGGITAGTRSYAFVYEWQDQQGLIHRSAPSIAYSVTFGGANNNVDLVIPTLRLTEKPNVSIVVYRTVAGGTTFYRVSSIQSPTLNSTSVDTVTINDTLADSSITSNELLYTTGGVVENIAPPSAKYVTTYRNRAMLLGLEDPNEMWFSKPFVQGEGAAFNDSFILRVDKGEQGLVAGAEMDEKFIIFKRTNTFVMAGNGPLDTGLQNDFGTPEQISSDVGCSEPRSVVSYPDGILFKSDKGIYRVSRALRVEYIGADVEAFNGLTITSAVLVEDQNQVRFTTSDGVCLVFDYFLQQWSTFDNYLSTCATVWNGVYHMGRSTGEINGEDKDVFLDNSSNISIELETPWISVGQLQGFQRVYRAMLLGDFKQTHTFRVEIGYDFEEFYSESMELNTSTALGSGYYGQGYYGQDGFIGSLSDWNYQIEIKPARQKCTSIRFKISDVNTANLSGELVAFSHLALLVGVKGGLNRTPGTKAALTK